MEKIKFGTFLTVFIPSTPSFATNMYSKYKMSTMIPNLTSEKFINDCMWIIDILKAKFLNWTMRYDTGTLTEPQTYTIREFERIIRDIYPNFYWMNQKNMLANLDTFANMNNWGQKEVSEMKQLIVENYIPLNNDVETPHSSTPTTSNHNSQMIDFIKYYQSISMLDNKLFDNLYSHFLPLFKMIYV